MPLYWRLLLGNVVTVVGGFVVLALSPFQIDAIPTPEQASVLALGGLAIVVVNAALIGDALTPLSGLRESIEAVDNPDEVQHLPVVGRDEVAALTHAYNAMLDRLQVERLRTVRAALRSQEDERARIARELHDEVGQTMTFLLIQLTMKIEALPDQLREEFEPTLDVARSALDEVRTISRRLRPGALADLGIGSALESIIEDARRLTGLPIDLSVAPGLGKDTDRDLVIYRVTQEALTNIVKHARATQVAITVDLDDDRVVLTIVDDGVGTTGPDGTGTYSMQERARLVDGHFERIAEPGVGTRVRLTLPVVVSGAGQAEDVLDQPTRPLPVITVFPPPDWLA